MEVNVRNRAIMAFAMAGVAFLIALFIASYTIFGGERELPENVAPAQTNTPASAPATAPTAQ